MSRAQDTLGLGAPRVPPLSGCKGLCKFPKWPESTTSTRSALYGHSGPLVRCAAQHGPKTHGRTRQAPGGHCGNLKPLGDETAGASAPVRVLKSSRGPYGAAGAILRPSKTSRPRAPRGSRCTSARSTRVAVASPGLGQECVRIINKYDLCGAGCTAIRRHELEPISNELSGAPEAGTGESK
jgi:hypothetical protein